MKPYIRVAGLATILSVIAFDAIAQTTVTTSAPSDTTINVGQLLAPWLQGLVAAAVSVIMACFGWLTVIINTRANMQNNVAVLQMEAHARELLETALTNAAGWVVIKAGPALDKMSFDVKSPFIVQAVMTINNLAGTAVKQFGLSPEDLAKKVIAKIGVLTASNSSVSPTTTESAPAT
jgi:hypothetical protein